jgi:acetyl esterase/lipase
MRIRRFSVAVLLLVAVAGCSSSTPVAKDAKPAPVAAASPLHPTAAPTTAFPVGERNITANCGTMGVMLVNIWYPAASVGTDTPFATGEFPAVLFSHGFDLIPGNYDLLLKTWAAAGITVIAPNFPHTAAGSTDYDTDDLVNQPAEASCALTKALADPILRAHVDASRIAAAGHSGGALTTVGLLSGDRDPRLIAGVVLAGGTLGLKTYTGSPAPILFVHGTKDPTVLYSLGQHAYTTDPWPKAFLTLPGETHLDPYTNPNDSALATVIATTTDFLRWPLYGDVAAKARLATDAKPAGQLAQDWGSAG